MRCALFVACLFAAAMAAHAQVQEEKMQAWVDANWKRTMQAMTTDPKTNPSAKNYLADKTFTGGTFASKSFEAPAFGGVKGAPMKTFETRSFLGVKNPWFGKKIFDTYASSATSRSASDAGKKFQTDAFAVREYDKGGKKDLVDANTVAPSGAQPRPYLVTPKAEGGVNRFTENLHKDLTIDDVRDLLNKGHGE